MKKYYKFKGIIYFILEEGQHKYLVSLDKASNTDFNDFINALQNGERPIELKEKKKR